MNKEDLIAETKETVNEINGIVGTHDYDNDLRHLLLALANARLCLNEWVRLTSSEI